MFLTTVDGILLSPDQTGLLNKRLGQVSTGCAMTNEYTCDVLDLVSQSLGLVELEGHQSPGRLRAGAKTIGLGFDEGDRLGQMLA